MEWDGDFGFHGRGVELSSLTMTSSASAITPLLPFDLDPRSVGSNRSAISRSLASASSLRCGGVSPDLGHGSADPHPCCLGGPPTIPLPRHHPFPHIPSSFPRPPAEPCDQPSPMSPQEHEIAQLRLRTFDTAIGTRHTPRNVYIR
jgi:hypothetical protein